MEINERTESLREEIYQIASVLSTGSIHSKQIEERDKALAALTYLQEKGIIDDDFPVIKSMKDVSRIIDLKSIVETMGKSFSSVLQDRSIERGISVTATSRCDSRCAHCETESVREGRDLDYRLLEGADPKFLRLFNIAHFSFEGDCLLIRSESNDGQIADLSDYISLLYSHGIKRFVLVNKTLSDEPVYKRVQSFFHSHPDAILNQRISFNLYSPHIFGKKDQMGGLKKEFLPMLHAAMQAAGDIRLNVNGSFKYDRSDILRTVEYLCRIMEKEGFRAVREHFMRNFPSTTPERDGEELALCQKYDEPYQVTIGGGMIPPADSKMDTEYEEMMQVFGEFFGKPSDNVPRGIDILPSYFANPKTGRVITVVCDNTRNRGRWQRARKGNALQETNRFETDGLHKTRPICPAFFMNRFTVDAEGNIYLCSGTYYKDVPFAHLSHPGEVIFDRMEERFEAAKQAYMKNIKDIVTGNYNTWLCRRDR